MDLQSQIIYVDQNNSKKSLHILENGASSVRVDISNTELSKIVSNMIQLHYIDFFPTNCVGL